MFRMPSKKSCRSPRRGLAPLELVLALPLLLFMMALMIDYGAVASWKVRTAMVARDAVWSARWPRNPGTMPQPANWPVGAARGTQGPGAAVQALTVLADPAIDQPVARGPNMGQSTVVRTLLDPTRGMMQGTAGITRPMPLLPAMPPIRFNLTHPLLTDGWQIQTAAMNQLNPPGGSNNGSRRETIIYQFAQAGQNLIQAYQNAVVQIWFSPLQQPLTVLSQDQEFINFYGAARNFYPGMNGFCSLDVNAVQQNNVQPLLYQIQGRGNPHVAGVPESLGRAFIQLYQAESQLPGANVAALQAQIQALQQFVNGPAQQAAL